MAFDIKLTITGLQKAQDRMNRMVAALQPQGAMGEAIRFGSAAAHRYAVQITHVDTGTLRAAHRETLDLGRLRAVIDVKPARNPRTGESARDYGKIEHDRGGTHAFYKRTETEAGARILGEMVRIVKTGVVS